MRISDYTIIVLAVNFKNYIMENILEKYMFM
jgi:hypothetical protein